MQALLILFFIQALTISEFEDTTLAEGERVHISGYLTQVTEDQAYLSSTPNLKTCCIPKTPGFWIKGNFPANIDSKAVIVEGIAAHTPKLNIEQAKVVSVKEERSQWPYILFAAIVCVAYIFWRRKRKA